MRSRDNEAIAAQRSPRDRWSAGRRVKFHLLALYLFGQGENAGKLMAERVYFDNKTVLQQINGTLDPASVPEFAERRTAKAQ